MSSTNRHTTKITRQPKTTSASWKGTEMPTEQKTAGLLPRPVWLVVRPDGEDQCRALGPFRTLERLTGAIEGIMWASPGDDVSGYAGEVPNDCEEINIE